MAAPEKPKTTPSPARELKPLEEMRNTLMSPPMAQELKMALPAHISVEKFQRVAVTAILQSPDLAQCRPASVYAACLKCAQDGLIPDGREAALVKFNFNAGTKQHPNWETRATYMPMVAGVLKKIRNSGELKELSPHVVYESDEFSYWIDDQGEHLEHTPNILAPDRGKPIAVYAIAMTKDGGRYIEVMSAAQVEQVRGASKAKDEGPWKFWWGEMARKTVIRRLAKRLPMSTDKDEELARVLHRDDDLYDLERPTKEMGPVDVAAPPVERPSRLQAVVDKAKPAAAPSPAQPEAEQPPADHPANDTPPDDNAPQGEIL